MADRCRACDAPVLWLTNDRTGKPAPIDADPNPEGNVTIDDATGTYRVHGGGNRPMETTYTSHFATCPQAARFRS